MSKSKNYTDQDVVLACAESFSYRQVLIKLGLNCQTGGAYVVLKNIITRLSIDISHFTHGSWNKGKKFPSKRDISVYLSNQVKIGSHALKLRLFKENLKQKKCESCGLESWLGGPIPLELDHINGIHDDNSLSNLRILCPNCHHLTPTHAGKNRKIGRKISSKKTAIKPSVKKESKSVVRKTKIEWPEPSILQQMLWEMSTTSISKMLGVSDKAIEKFSKKHSLTKPPRGYWAKKYAERGT